MTYLDMREIEEVCVVKRMICIKVGYHDMKNGRETFLYHLEKIFICVWQFIQFSFN